MPHTIGRYKIIERLGDGGMASVYRAYDPRFEREVAVKVIAAHFMHNDEFRTRFVEEAKVIASLEHPAIVPVYDFGEENGQPFLVMRLMKGGSLNDWLAKGQIPLSQVVDLLERLAPALDTAHRFGIVHRDIKPDNILFDDVNHPYIADFGIAKLIEQTSLGLTQTGNPIGSPPYMSPEQARGLKQVDGRSDIYSLGILLFELLSGQRPYQADSLFGYIHQHLNEPIPNICQINPTLPKACQNVILRAMAKEPTQRYSSAGEMVAELKAITHTQNMTPQSRKPWSPLWALLAGGVGALFILCFVIILGLAANGLGGILAVVPTATPKPTVTPSRTATPTLPPTSTLTPTPAFTPTPNASSYIERGDALRNEGQHEQAIVAYAKAIDLDPNNADAYFGRGFSHGERNELDLAIADYDEVIRLNPDYTVAYNNRGFAYFDQGQLDLAIADYDQAIRINPDYVLAYNNRGNAYLKKGEIELAIADYDQAIRLNPNDADAYNNRGNAYREQGQLELAITYYDQAIRLNPNLAQAYNNRGFAYREQDQLELAIADYDQAIRLNPDYAVAYAGRGLTYRQQGKLDLAIADYDQAIGLEPDYALAYNNRGFAYEKKGQLDLAIADYRKALQLDNDASATKLARENLQDLGVQP